MPASVGAICDRTLNSPLCYHPTVCHPERSIVRCEVEGFASPAGKNGFFDSPSLHSGSLRMTEGEPNLPHRLRIVRRHCRPRGRFVCLKGNDTGQKESGNDYGTLKAKLSVGTADPAGDSSAFLPLAKIIVRPGPYPAANLPPAGWILFSSLQRSTSKKADTSMRYLLFW